MKLTWSMQTVRKKRVNAHVLSAEFSGYEPHSLAAIGAFNPKKILRQQLAKAPVNLGNARSRDGGVACESAGINPLLHCDVRLGFDLQVSLAPVLAVVVLKRAFDVHGVRIVALNEVGVVAVHRA
jgi:hypothetical protein